MAKDKASGKNKRPRLGRGLSSLMAAPPAPVEVQPADSRPTATPDSSATTNRPIPGDSPSDGGLQYLAVDSLSPNPHQPRQTFDPGPLAALAESIRRDGVMQPVVVRKVGNAYQLVAGERRWRAAQHAGLEQIPAIIRQLSDQQVAEWALIENLQREDLDPIERAQAFQRLIDQFSLSHEQVAERVGVERPTVSNSLRLLDLQESIQAMIRRGVLSAGHARALLGVDDDQARQALADKTIKAGWSVRSLEQTIRQLNADASPTAPAKPSRAAHLSDLEKQIGRQLNTKVRLTSGRKKGSGTISIEFYSLDQFDELLGKLGVKID